MNITIKEIHHDHLTTLFRSGQFGSCLTAAGLRAGAIPGPRQNYVATTTQILTKTKTRAREDARTRQT